MENHYCYVEFEFSDLNQFENLKSTFEAIKNSKNNSDLKEDRFWLDLFPKYSLEKFTFLESDIKPDFQTAKASESTWHFYSLIELLSINLEVEYIDLKIISSTNAILKYDPYSYPYGSINGLIAFIESFNCRPKEYDDGTGVYSYSKNEIKTNNAIWKLFNLKKIFKFSIVLLFISFSISCNNKTNSLQFEKDVMYEIYPKI
nr:hypothetical protein [uncultured Flavobacterium sp.]